MSPDKEYKKCKSFLFAAHDRDHLGKKEKKSKVYFISWDNVVVNAVNKGEKCSDQKAQPKV